MKCMVNHKIRVMQVKNPKFRKEDFCNEIGISRVTLFNHEKNPETKWPYKIALKISEKLNLPLSLIPHTKVKEILDNGSSK